MAIELNCFCNEPAFNSHKNREIGLFNSFYSKYNVILDPCTCICSNIYIYRELKFIITSYGPTRHVFVWPLPLGWSAFMPRKGHPLRLFSLPAPVFPVKGRKDRCGLFRSTRYWPCCHSFPPLPSLHLLSRSLLFRVTITGTVGLAFFRAH